ncbi:UNVERIFIED_CONTAM: hypothetical protein FKN15_047414 [Acipenser sinensis]
MPAAKVPGAHLLLSSISSTTAVPLHRLLKKEESHDWTAVLTAYEQFCTAPVLLPPDRVVTAEHRRDAALAGGTPEAAVGQYSLAGASDKGTVGTVEQSSHQGRWKVPADWEVRWQVVVLHSLKVVVLHAHHGTLGSEHSSGSDRHSTGILPLGCGGFLQVL